MQCYRFHLTKFLLSTSHLDIIHECVLRRLIDYYYLKENPIPHSDHELSEVIRILRLSDYESCVKTILNEFFDLHHDGWHNELADKEILMFNEKIDISTIDSDQVRSNSLRGEVA